MKPTLVVFIKALVGQKLDIELRNESILTGTLEEVDDHMNLILLQGQFHAARGESFSFDELFVPGRLIRFIPIPTHINVAATLERYSKRTEAAKAMYKRKMIRPDRKREAPGASAAASGSASTPASTAAMALPGGQTVSLLQPPPPPSS